MNESLFLEITKLAIQASFITRTQFAGILYDYDTNEWVILLVLLPPVRFPVDVLTDPNILKTFILAFRKALENGRSSVVA